MLRIQFFLFVLITIGYHAANAKSCVATDEENRYLCTDDAAKANAFRNKNPSANFSFEDLGVVQIIQGTEQEKAAVNEVMEKMREYMLHEVLAKPEYAPIRDECKNNEALCAFWSSVGECDSNRPFMIANCRAACRLCLQARAFPQ